MKEGNKQKRNSGKKRGRFKSGSKLQKRLITQKILLKTSPLRHFARLSAADRMVIGTILLRITLCFFFINSGPGITQGMLKQPRSSRRREELQKTKELKEGKKQESKEGKEGNKQKGEFRKEKRKVQKWIQVTEEIDNSENSVEETLILPKKKGDMNNEIFYYI